MIAAYAYGHLLALLMWGQTPIAGAPCWQQAAVQIDIAKDGTMLVCEGVTHFAPQPGTWRKMAAGGWPAPMQSIADNPSAPGECYTNKPTGEMVLTTKTFAECEVKHGMWHRDPPRADGGNIVLPDSARYGPGAYFF